MSQTKRILLTLFLALSLGPVPGFSQEAPNSDNPQAYVLLLSFDGFRSDYVERWNLKHFKRLARLGASSEGLIPAHPSNTFPNHYSLVTGLYPGHHGIVDNSFYDPGSDRIYSLSRPQAIRSADFYGGLPLWQLVQQNGFKSASYFWVGSEAPIAGRLPDYSQAYRASTPNETRIKDVMTWLRLPLSERPAFTTLYFSLVDSVAHDYGPDSEQSRKAALYADKLLGQIMTELASIRPKVNLIVSSDHGMYPVQNASGSYIPMPELKLPRGKGNLIVSGQAQAHIYLDDDADVALIYEKLQKQEGRYQAYLREETPSEWHYRHHAHIGDIVLAAEPGYLFSRNREQLELHGAAIGVHGYPPRSTPWMNGIFYAYGPNILPGVRLPAFENVHLYPFITRILGLTAPHNIDGREEVLLPAYRK